MMGTFKGLVTLPEKRYLAVGIMMPWENNLDIQFSFWRDASESGAISRLKERCGSEEVVGLFCYHCDMIGKTFSYHIACENRRGASPGPFEPLVLKPLTYARFEGGCAAWEDGHAAYERLCDAFWSQWLPASGYVSLIEPETGGCEPGYAAIERFTPEVPLTAYRMEMLFPVARNA